jgi:hypothetical protein
VCPKLRYRDGVPIQSAEGACARCRICAQDLERVPIVQFPIKHYLSRRPPPDALLEILS